MQQWLLGMTRRYLFEPYAVKVARTVLRGGKPERAYLSQLFNSMTHEQSYHNLNIFITLNGEKGTYTILFQ